MFMRDRLFLGFRLLSIILMTVMMATAPVFGHILLYLVMNLTAVMPNVHPARRISHQQRSDCKEAR